MEFSVTTDRGNFVEMGQLSVNTWTNNERMHNIRPNISLDYCDPNRTASLNFSLPGGFAWRDFGCERRDSKLLVDLSPGEASVVTFQWETRRVNGTEITEVPRSYFLEDVDQIRLNFAIAWATNRESSSVVEAEILDSQNQTFRKSDNGVFEVELLLLTRCACFCLTRWLPEDTEL